MYLVTQQKKQSTLRYGRCRAERLTVAGSRLVLLFCCRRWSHWDIYSWTERAAVDELHTTMHLTLASNVDANREDLSLLLSSVKPTIVALQETHIGKNHNINFRNYSFYNTPGTENNGIYHGGSALIVSKATPHSLISLRTTLQATAVRLTVFKTITVCSVYLPPSQKWDIKDLEDLYRQLPSPTLGVILVSEVMNLPMRLQKRLSAQQSQLWSAQPLTLFQSSPCTIVKCGRLNGMDAVLVVTLLFWEDYALVTHVLPTNIYSLAIANHSARNVNAL